MEGSCGSSIVTTHCSDEIKWPVVSKWNLTFLFLHVPYNVIIQNICLYMLGVAHLKFNSIQLAKSYFKV